MERNIDIEVYTQSVPVPTSIVGLINDDTPKDYEHLSTGFCIPVAHFMASNLKVKQIHCFKNLNNHHVSFLNFFRYIHLNGKK